MRGVDMTVKTAGLHEIHAGGRHPVTFVIRAGQFALRADAHAIGRAMAGGDDLQFTAVFIHTNEAAVMRHRGRAQVAALDEIKISFRIRGQVEAKFVVVVAD